MIGMVYWQDNVIAWRIDLRHVNMNQTWSTIDPCLLSTKLLVPSSGPFLRHSRHLQSTIALLTTFLPPSRLILYWATSRELGSLDPSGDRVDKQLLRVIKQALFHCCLSRQSCSLQLFICCRAGEGKVSSYRKGIQPP